MKSRFRWKIKKLGRAIGKKPRKNPWVEALKTFAENPFAEIVCPICKRGRLGYRDVPISGGKERILKCDRCGKYEAAVSWDKS